MGDHGKRKPDKPDPRPVDLSEPGAVIPLWYWTISPRAYLHRWRPEMRPPEPALDRRPRRNSVRGALLAMALLGLRR